jgi:NADPH:quinone reductase-like Zn-dependent oxidoreductase
MRAMSYATFGGVEQLRAVDVPRPAPGEGQVLVRVRRASVNPVDWKIGSGKLRFLMPVSLPAIPCLDIAGEVEELGPGVRDFAVGAAVHARVGAFPGRGAAEFAVAGVDVTAPIPDGMSLEDAAAIPLAGLTALQGLRAGGLPDAGAGQRVLVVGASGGVGHFGVQIARAAGAHVTGVCSARNAELVASLGAHETVDYAAAGAYDGKAPWDVVLDCVGSAPGFFMPKLAANGHYASCVAGPGTLLRLLCNPFSGRKAHAVMVRSNATDLTFLDRLYAAGKLKVVIDSRFPLEKLSEAWIRSMGGRSVGKIIVEVG